MIFLTKTLVISFGNDWVGILTYGLGVKKSLNISLFSTLKFLITSNTKLLGVVEYDLTSIDRELPSKLKKASPVSGA